MRAAAADPDRRQGLSRPEAVGMKSRWRPRHAFATFCTYSMDRPYLRSFAKHLAFELHSKLPR